jgi:hypothetical protein
MTRLILLISATILLPVHASGQPASIFVASNGSDANAGTAEKPLASLAGARDAIRKQRQQQPGMDARVIIADGTYPMGGTVEFTPEDSGVTYEAAPGAKPVFSGGTRITGWTKQDGPIWQAKVPEVAAGNWYFEQLWINGRRATRARTPNEDWSYLRGMREKGLDPVTGNETNLLHALILGYPDDLAPLAKVPKDEISDVTAVVYHSWEIARHRGRFYDPENTAFYVTPITDNNTFPFINFSAESRYHLENFREALDAPGEWFLGRDGTLLYRPMPGEDMETAEVFAPRLDQFLRITGAAGKPVENLTFRGLRFLYGQYILPPGGHADGQAAISIPAVVMADFAKQVTLEDCEIAHVGVNAIWFGSGCTGNVVRQCYLHDLGAGGVKIGSQTPAISSHNVVENNIIRGGGRIHYGAIGIWIGPSSDNIIAHNDISDFVYTGISVGWSWGYGESMAKRNRIESNHIHHLGSGVLGDMAGIYTLGMSEGTMIRGNHIHHLRSSPYPGVFGIYLDEGSTGITVRDNLVHDILHSCFFQHYGRDNVLENNIFAFSLGGVLRRARVEAHESFRAERNIMVSQSGPFVSGTMHQGKITMDHNLYWRADGQGADFDRKTFSEWQAGGQDAHSLVADPGFADLARRDFKLADDSPALGLGFVPFDITQAGVTGSPAWRKLAAESSHVDFTSPLRRPPVPPLDIEDGFEPGSASFGYTIFNGGEARALAPTEEAAASGKRSLKFADQAGLKYTFDPHLAFSPRHHGGLTQCSFDLRIGPGVELQHDWRDNASPYLSGPSFVISGGVLQMAGKTLPLPQDQWIHFEIKTGLGAQSTGTWEMTVQVPGEPAHHFTDLPSQPGWKTLDWLGFISNANGPSVFYLDNVVIKNSLNQRK